MQRIPIDENVSCHTHKQFHQMLLSHVTVADPDSSDSNRLCPNERYKAERYGLVQFNTRKIFTQRA